MAQKLNLIADIGGTNARFALVEQGSVTAIEPKSLPCAEYPTIVDAAQAYLGSVPYAVSDKAAIAIATPVTGDQLTMTNHSWDFSVKAVSAALGLAHLKVLNDYTALALALPYLTEDHWVKIGGGEKKKDQVMAVIGPGTGLGVSGVIPVNSSWLPLEGEGGHISYGPLDDDEARLIELIRQKKGHVSAETLVSGPGLSVIYEMLSQLDGNEPHLLKPHEVTQKALEESHPVAVKALSMMFGILGTVSGNLALTLGARGGVFIGGGIIPRALEFFNGSSFRARFENKGRFTRYLSEIPTYVINTDYPAMIGAAASLQAGYQSVGVNSDD